MIRDDISDRLIHLTRGSTYEDAANNLLAILNEKQLRGGNDGIEGADRRVCFTEAPISQLSQILADRTAHAEMRYMPFGVMVSKAWLFEKGGRPVIYQPDSDFELLHNELKYRHKRYDPTKGSADFDSTWEREWRIRTNELRLDPDDVTVVAPNRAFERRILQAHEGKIQRMMGLSDISFPSSVIQSPWHFIALEDLGVTIPSE